MPVERGQKVARIRRIMGLIFTEERMVGDHINFIHEDATAAVVLQNSLNFGYNWPGGFMHVWH